MALNPLLFLINLLLKSSILDVRAPEPDFQDLARALNLTISIYNPLLKSPILDGWAPEPDHYGAQPAKPRLGKIRKTYTKLQFSVEMLISYRFFQFFPIFSNFFQFSFGFSNFPIILTLQAGWLAGEAG